MQDARVSEKQHSLNASCRFDRKVKSEVQSPGCWLTPNPRGSYDKKEPRFCIFCTTRGAYKRRSASTPLVNHRPLKEVGTA